LPNNVRKNKIEIYNIKGQLVDELKIVNKKSEINKIVWDARDYSPGIYFYKLNIEDSPVGKMVLVK